MKVHRSRQESLSKCVKLSSTFIKSRFEHAQSRRECSRVNESCTRIGRSNKSDSFNSHRLSSTLIDHHRLSSWFDPFLRKSVGQTSGFNSHLYFPKAKVKRAQESMGADESLNSHSCPKPTLMHH